MDPKLKPALLEYLTGFVSDNKRTKFEAIVQQRTRYVTVVLEDLYQPHNASAVLRSCDCFGIQDVHIIENANTYEVNPDVALGASKWLNLIRYNTTENNTPEAIATLKTKGYRIVATTPHRSEVTLQQLDLNQGPVALLFGTEMRGLSADALAGADEFMIIPMVGFTESFNISVSAALSLFYLTEKLRNSSIPWQLSAEEQIDTKLDWVRKVVKSSEGLIKDFLRKQTPE
ncbi:MAG: TrmH family RNA methyltransferase [Clostridia bacterium]|nr:TrmH family RNA methyltransferase [Clostridia bacterium]